MIEHVIYAPQLGESVRFLRVLEFLKKPGDTITIDEPIVLVETDKASMEIESPVSGIIQNFRVELHAEVPIGEALASIMVTDHALTNPRLNPFSSSHGPGYVDHTLSEQQILLANRMRISSTQIIPSCLHTVCESEPIVEIRKFYREFVSGTIPSSTEIFAWCALKAMQHHPKFRSVLQEDGSTVRQFNHATVGVAVSMPEDDLTMLSISDKDFQNNLLEFSKSYKHKLSETKLGKNHNGFHSLSISDLSAFDIQTAVPVIVSPAIATLCIGRVYGRSLSERSYGLSLAFDHRVINGVGAANFLKSIKKELYNLASKVTLPSDISYMVQDIKSTEVI